MAKEERKYNTRHVGTAAGRISVGKRAKKAARQVTEQGSIPTRQPYRAKSTALSAAMALQKQERTLPEGVGKYSKELDTALPGKHTKQLYDTFRCAEANVLEQLRTGMIRLNEYLPCIGAAESAVMPLRSSQINSETLPIPMF